MISRVVVNSLFLRGDDSRDVARSRTRGRASAMSVASAPPADGGLALEPPRPRGGASGGIFSYWFGTSSLRADPSEVFAGLVYRLRARDAAFTPHELALLKQCETDVQVRAVTAGYVTGAGTHSALGFVSKRAPRLMLSALAGVCGAYAGVQSMARDCMRRIARLEDSQLAADARFVIRQVAPHDPLGREPTGAHGEGGEEAIARDAAKTAAGYPRRRRSRAEEDEIEKTTARHLREDRADDDAYGRESEDIARLEMRAASASSDGEGRPTLDTDARAYVAPRTKPNAKSTSASASSEWGRESLSSPLRFIPRDAFSGISIESTLSGHRGDDSAVRRGGRRRPGAERDERRRAAVDAARSRRREEKSDRNVVLFSSGTDARDELIDPAPRVSFDRGTRRTSYGDVLDR
jgi:hypothetical protein